MTKRNLLALYVNGNYTVRLYDDGSKTKITAQDEFVAEFPDSIDLKITDYCDMGCPMCHESSSTSGLHGDVSLPLLSTLHRGTELAIGGGNPLSHPKLINLLQQMKEQGVICNLTVNERHLLKHKAFIRQLINDRLIWGLGISLNGCDDETLQFAADNRNAVLHCICGILDEQTAKKLYGKNLKILLLGYKSFGRGKSYYSPQIDERIKWLQNSILSFSNKFAVVSFDNLALAQLDMRNKIPQDLFEQRYMGDDGMASMYIDLVKLQFASGSTSQTRYPLPDTLSQAFATVRAEKLK